MNMRNGNRDHTVLHSASRRRLLRQSLRGTLGVLLLPAAGSSLLAACGGGDGSVATTPVAAAPVPPTPILASVNNFRDVVGADDALAYTTSGGQKLRRGVFYRSNVLTPSGADLATLDTLGIRTVYDLRTPTEITTTPDVLPAGAAWVNVNIMGTDSASTPTLGSPSDAIAYMEQFEQQLVTDAGMRERLGQLFTDMAGGANAQLFHCTAGKDRTGWVAAVLLTLVGVPQSVVIQDYLLTNIYSAASIQASYNAMITADGEAYADNFYPLLGAQTSFLMAGFNQAVTSYGSMSGYITNGLGLSNTTQAQLKAKLLG